LVSSAGFPSSHEVPWHVVRVPSVVMVTSRAGENDAQRTWLLGFWAIRQARFLVGERKVPLLVAVASGRTTAGAVELAGPDDGVELVDPGVGVVVVDPDVG